MLGPGSPEELLKRASIALKRHAERSILRPFHGPYHQYGWDFLDSGRNSWPGPSAENCRGFLLYKIWRILSGIFLEDFSGHFFPTKMRKNPATKSATKSGGSKIKICENAFCQKPTPKILEKFRSFFGNALRAFPGVPLESPAGTPKPYNSRRLRLPDHFQNSLPLSTAGDASFSEVVAEASQSWSWNSQQY